MVLHAHCGGDASVLLCRVCVDIVPDLCITTCDLIGSSGSMLGVHARCVPLEQHHPLSDLKTWQYKSPILTLQDPVQKLRPGP